MPSALKRSKEKPKPIVQVLLLGREQEVDGCRGRGILVVRRITWTPTTRSFPSWDIIRNQITFWKEPSMGPVTLIAPALNQQCSALRAFSFLRSCLAEEIPVQRYYYRNLWCLERETRLQKAFLYTKASNWHLRNPRLSLKSVEHQWGSIRLF